MPPPCCPTGVYVLLAVTLSEGWTGQDALGEKLSPYLGQLMGMVKLDKVDCTICANGQLKLSKRTVSELEFHNK